MFIFEMMKAIVDWFRDGYSDRLASIDAFHRGDSETGQRLRFQWRLRVGIGIVFIMMLIGVIILAFYVETVVIQR